MVIHKGDKKKNIEGTGAVRMMGEIQFNKFGKQNGWAKAPAETKLPKAETGTEDSATSASTDTGSADKGTNAGGGSSSVDVTKFNAKDLIAKIKEHGEAGETDQVKAIKDAELEQEDSRSTVIAAADKYLNA